MLKDSYPVRWTGRRAVVALPEHIGQVNAGKVREELLSVINCGADALIVDMTATISCDYTGADALLRARQRALASGTELRLAVTNRIVRRALSLSGLDHLISIYPSVEAAVAAREPSTAAGPPGLDDGPAVTPEVLRALLDALDDGVALADRDGIVVAASRRLEEMFGYQYAELSGRRADSLTQESPREARPGHETALVQAIMSGLAGRGTRLAGTRKDGTRFPVELRTTPAAQFTLIAIRDVTGKRPERPSRYAAGGQRPAGRDLAGSIMAGLSRAEGRLRAALESSRSTARPRIMQVLWHLTDGIREFREIRLSVPRQDTASRQIPQGDVPAASEPQAGSG